MTSANISKRLRNLAKVTPEIEDILLFGSTVRGKERPEDVDILLLFKEHVNKTIEHRVRVILEEEYKNIAITSKTKTTALESSFDARESMLFEAKSLLTGENLAETYGFSPLGMFKYDIKEWTNLKRTKFYYALNGRGENKGFLHTLDGIKLSDRILLVALDKVEPMREFLESWELEYTYIPTIIPQRMNKNRILEK